jgi:hypothetical protein
MPPPKKDPLLVAHPAVFLTKHDMRTTRPLPERAYAKRLSRRKRAFS